jgi:hypothetical protein
MPPRVEVGVEELSAFRPIDHAASCAIGRSYGAKMQQASERA